MVAETQTFDLYVRGAVPAAMGGSLFVAAARRHKDRSLFSRWHDSQADLIRLDLHPGKPGRIKARILSVDPWKFCGKTKTATPFYPFQPNHGLNIEGDTLWATNLLFGAPLEVDLAKWKPRRSLGVVPLKSDAPQLSSTSHFAFDLDRRFAYFHESALRQGERTVLAQELSLVRLDTRTGRERVWKLQPPHDDAEPEVHNFHSAFYFEEAGKRYLGLLRTGAIVESLAPHSVPTEHPVVPMKPSTIWIVELDDSQSTLQASLLPGISELGAIALSHLDVDASSRNGFVLYANYKQADVGEETHGENLYGEQPAQVAEHYSGMTVEALNYGLVFRYERVNGRYTLRKFSRPYDPKQTSLGHSWLPINIELNSNKEFLFCSFAGFRPRLLPKHVARAYGDAVVDVRRIRHVPPLLMRFHARDLSPDYDNDRTYLSYTEPIAFAVAGNAPDEFVWTFSPETGLKLYRSHDLSQVVCHAISPYLMNWRDSHFRPDPAHMVYLQN
jgi:hypothetical protein